MKIVEAISDTNIGGAGILLLTRLQYSDKKRSSYHVILPKESALTERLKAIGVTVWEIDAGKDRSLSLLAIPQYLSLLRYLDPDLINCHGTLSCRIAAWLCRVPCRVYTRHCAYPPKSWQTRFPGRWLLGRLQGMLSERVIAVADAAKQNLTDMGVASERISVIINGTAGLRACSEEEQAALRARLRIPHGTTVIGICARLEPCKDHHTFLRAAERLLKTSERYRFLIIGEGSLARELKEFCHAREIEKYVHFTGFLSDVAPYFHIMDLNVNCSIGTETSSLALSEGMSLGIPAVVSDYGGNPYMVRHGENGLVYAQGRDDQLADALARLAQDRALYDRLSEGAYRRFRDELNAEQMTKKTERLYEELFHSVKCPVKASQCRNKSKGQRRRRSS